MENTKKSVNLTNGNLFKKILIFALPIMASGLLQLFYSAADLVVCGKFGSGHSVAAISATTALINLMVQLFIGMSVGSNVLMARAYATNDKTRAKTILNTSIIFALSIGIVLTIIGFFCSRLFLTWMNTPDDVIDLSTDYLKIYCLGLIFSMIYNFGSALVRATGDTKNPFIFLVIAGIINICFNLLFVIVFNLDVKGVAISTVISEAVSAFLIILLLLKGNILFKLNIKELKLSKKDLIDIAHIGIPAGIQNSVFSVANVLIQSSINSLGAITMDADGASSSLEGFVYTVMNAIAQATLVFVSANYAVNNKKNIKKSLIYSIILCSIFSAIAGGLVIIFGKQLLSLYTNYDEAISIGYKRLVILCSTYFLCGYIDILSFAIRGIGYSLVPTLVTTAGCCVYRVIWVLTVFKIDKYHTNTTLSLAYPISWIITSGVHLICFIYFFRKIKINDSIKDLELN